MNILEHIQNERKALKDSRKTLPRGGKLLVFVPAIPSLYKYMDISYGHFRRYDKKELETKITEAGFELVNAGI